MSSFQSTMDFMFDRHSCDGSARMMLAQGARDEPRDEEGACSRVSGCWPASAGHLVEQLLPAGAKAAHDAYC